MVAVTRSASIVGAGLAALGSLLACPSLDPFACQGDEQCTLASEGVCHDQGVCSYPDDVCDSGRRYSSNAGALADQCVDETNTTQTGSGSTDASGSSGAPDSSGPGPLPVCGDGIVEGDEQCDDGMDELDPMQCNDCTADCQRVEVTMQGTFGAEGQVASFFTVIVDDRGALVAAGRTALPHDADAGDVANSGSHDWLVARFDPSGGLQADFNPSSEGRDQINTLLHRPMEPPLAIGMRDTDPGNGNNGGSDNELVVAEYVDDELVPVYLHRSVDPNPSMGQHGAIVGGRLVVVGATDGLVGTGFERWDRLIIDDVLEAPQILDVPTEMANPALRDVAYVVAAAPDGGIVVGGNITQEGLTHSDRWLGRFGPDGTWIGPPYIDGGVGDGQEEVFGLIVRDQQVFAAGNQVVNEGNTEQEWMERISLEGLSPDGWAVNLPVERPASITGLVEDGDGFVVTVGLGDGAAVASIDENGLCQWLVHSPAGARRLSDVVREADGSIVVAGSASLDDTVTELNDYGGNALVARLRVGG